MLLEINTHMLHKHPKLIYSTHAPHTIDHLIDYEQKETQKRKKPNKSLLEKLYI